MAKMNDSGARCFICYAEISLQPSLLHFTEVITKLNVQVQSQRDYEGSPQTFLISEYPKARRNCQKAFNRDTFVEPGERSVSWPTVHLIEALQSIPTKGISVLLKSIT